MGRLLGAVFCDAGLMFLAGGGGCIKCGGMFFDVVSWFLGGVLSGGFFSASFFAVFKYAV